MSDASYLQNSILNLGVLRDHARKEFLDCLDETGSAQKCVVLDPEVGLLNVVADRALMEKRGVIEQISLNADLETPLTHIIYFVRPCIASMKRIVAHVKADQKKSFNVFFVPKVTTNCKNFLEDEGVYGDLFIHEYHLDILPLDSDLLSLEYSNSYKECLLDGDMTSLSYVARSLMKLQSVFGPIPDIVGKGEQALHVKELLLRLRKEQGKENEFGLNSEIDSLILIDRSIDLTTPFCTQLTYEGLISEVFGVTQGSVTVPLPLLPSNLRQQLPKTASGYNLQLNSGDNVYQEVRNYNFSAVGPWIKKRAREVGEEYEERNKAKSIRAVKDFVSKLGRLQAEHRSLSIHTNMASTIQKCTNGEEFLGLLRTEQMFLNAENTDKFNEYIEDCICRKEPVLKVLRLMCLQAQTNGGLKQKVADQYYREFIQTYGFEHIRTLYNLQKLGLYFVKKDKRRYDFLKTNLNLTVDVDEVEPDDMSYVYSGYAPISCRLIERLQSTGWRSLEPVLRELPGPHFEINNSKVPIKVGSAKHAKQKAKVSLVFFLGGVTSAEISAIRFLASKSPGHEYIIATTSLITGDTMLLSLMESLETSKPIPDRNLRSYYIDFPSAQ